MFQASLLVVFGVVVCAEAFVAPGPSPWGAVTTTKVRGDDSFEVPELPLDFGSGDAQWRFEWPADLSTAAEEEEEKPSRPSDVAFGAALFVTCHLNGLVLTQSQTLGAAVGAGAFLALQRTVPRSRWLSTFRWTQTIPVEKVGSTPWPLVALGASVPAFQAVLLPALLSSSSSGGWHLRWPDLTLQAVVASPLCEELVFRVWAMEAARNAKIPYAAAILADAALFGLWHGPHATSLGFALLGAYWAHLFAQTRNALLPIAMHVLWNVFALTNQASFDELLSSSSSLV
mmetsp:Transcript_24476/g.79044  ORF Transcript_24476/g.79044 Transcript_24476/m.79044 type:complete len:287 (-) Transcript_24476:515-1375(-)